MNGNAKKPPLIIIAGPTAVGKSDISVKIAKLIDGEIISADSMQVYKGMDIGTAKISANETQGIKHYLIDVLDPTDDFNIVTFKSLAKEAIENIYKNGKVPIICGGTGFYIQSVLYDIDFTEVNESSSYRNSLAKLAKEKGNAYLHKMLEKVDKASADKIHENDLKRVIRALEYNKETGECISKHNKEQAENTSPYDFLFFVLTDNRETIYEKINTRVDKMIEAGLVSEVKSLKEAGLNEEFVSMKGLGYKEILEYLEGKSTLEEAIYKIKRDSRHFAKRQLTWFKKEKDIIWLDKSELTEDAILSTVVNKYKKLSSED